MNLIITERDYELSLNRTEVKKLKGHEQEPILGPDDAADVLDALPKVLADRFRRMLPDNYEMSELQLSLASPARHSASVSLARPSLSSRPSEPRYPLEAPICSSGPYAVGKADLTHLARCMAVVHDVCGDTSEVRASE